MFEDPVKNSPKKKQKMSLSPKETKPETEISDNRKKAIKKPFTRKIEESEEGVSTSRPTLQSSWKCEEAFDKLCESPAYNQPKSVQVEDSSKHTSNLDLLFTDLPGEDDCAVDDPEDRLVISETEMPEVEQENIFSYQQETFLPNDTKIDFKDDIKPKPQVQREEPPSLPPVIEIKTVVPVEPKLTLGLVKPTPPPKVVEPKLLEAKPLDVASVLSPLPTVPVPISARLPVTSFIEEKLSAAAAFRNKTKETKKEDDAETSKKSNIKEKDAFKKSELASVRRIKEDQTKVKVEIETKRLPEELIIKQATDNLEEKTRSSFVVTKVKEELRDEKRTEIETLSSKLDLRKFNEERLEGKWKKSEEIFQEEERKVIDVEKNKATISLEFADSTDSSDSERRLIIDNEMEFHDEKLPKFEVKLNLDRGSSLKQNQERGSSLKINQEKSSNLKLNQERGPTLKPNFERGLSLKQNLDRTTSLKQNLDRNSPLKMSLSSTLNMNMASASEVERNQPVENVKFTVQNQARLQQAGLQCKFARADEEGENLNSLLCEEEIPGSPTPGADTIDHETAGTSHASPKPKMVDSSTVLMEMPFASAPTSSPSTTCATISTLSMSLPPGNSTMISVPLTVQQVPVPVRQEHPVPVQRQESNEAAPVMDNTPPTTPDSTISNICESPRDERTAGSSPLSEDNSKLNRDSSEVENDSKLAGLSEDDAFLLNSEGNNSDRPLKQALKRTLDDSLGSKKRKRLRTQTESGGNNSGKKSPRQSGRGTRHGAGSDSDDTSEGSNQCSSANSIPSGHSNVNITELNSYSSRSPRPTKYNFYVELGEF